ncbi:hypothetical protein SLS54_009789 [Diplodia seriata]
MSPSGIPIDGLTHINFAFAYIEPETYKVTTMDSETPANLFQGVADVASFKSGNEDLEVFVAIGGWTFSDNDTVTQPLFGEIAADAGKRQTFANNLVAFMELYGFDGVDLDWEYPGAPDRGGKEEDTQNYVLLLQTLRETFDARPKKFGLTFTIPSSYWYLRWFDLPGMVQHASWINLMSYDLHGFWDRLNPIGSIVQGHTNLTEIKLATELLWRVGIAPAKVVLGVGFYGRSFELKDAGCAEPGCAFGGLSKAGPCTGEGGILGYFEIQDIIREEKEDADGKLVRRSSEPTYLRDEAVKYITYDDNQWVSYDDSETFGQKVDWADEIGLGGLMIWSVDLDDDVYSALSGLTNKTLGVIETGPEAGEIDGDGKSVSQDWASQNGQECFLGDCVDEDGPADSGEINLLSVRGSDGDGGHHHCTSGWQIFCCKADRWAALIDQCGYAKCGADCDDGYEEVTSVYTSTACDTGSDGGGSPFSPPTSGTRKYCCPEPKKFTNCHWVGQGDCADNTCTNSEGEDDGSIELMTDSFGDSTSSCRWGRKKVCCCNPPADESAFLPVPLEYLFPDDELPSTSDTVKWDLQFPNGGSTTVSPDKQAFGFVLIDGASAAVSNVDKRDGSHLDFLGCESLRGTHHQTIRYVCTYTGPGSNCDAMLEKGIEGTVLKMPESCGEGTWAVAHKAELAADQSLPSHLADLSSPVMELTFDYNFGLVRRDSGDISLRVDYSNIPGYWNAVVDTPGSEKRSAERRGFGSLTWWTTKFSDLRSSGVFTYMEKTLNERLYSNTKECSGQDAYLDVVATGTLAARIKFGISIVGTIVPWSTSEAYAFFDAETDLNVNYDISALGNIKQSSTERYPLLRTRLQKTSFNHPGIVEMTPFLNAEVGLVADVDLTGNFSVGYRAHTDGYVSQAYPSGLEQAKGSALLEKADSPFSGSIRAASDGGMRISMMPEAGFEVKFNKYGTTGEMLGYNMTATTDTYAAVMLETEDRYVVSMGSDKAATSLLYAEGGTRWIDSWNADTADTSLHGAQPGAKQLAAGAPGDDDGDDPKGGPSGHKIEYDGAAALSLFKSMLSCSTKQAEICDCSDLCVVLGCDDADGDEWINARPDGAGSRRRRSIVGDLEKRADGERSFQVVNPATGRTRVIKYNDETDFPSVSEWEPIDDSRYDQAYGFADFNNCEDPTIVQNILPDIADVTPEDRYYHSKCLALPLSECLLTEEADHVFEMQDLPLALGDMAAGQLRSGAAPTTPAISAQFFIDAFNQQGFLANAPALRGGDNSAILSERLAITLGSRSNWAQFAIYEQSLNKFKAQIMALKAAMDAAKYTELVEGGDNPCVIVAVFRNMVGTFNYLNHPTVNGYLMTTLNDLRAQFQLAETAWNAAHPNDQVQLRAFWDEWIRDFLRYVVTHATNWANRAVQEAAAEWARRPADQQPYYNDALAAMRNLVGQISAINVVGLN